MVVIRGEGFDVFGRVWRRWEFGESLESSLWAAGVFGLSEVGTIFGEGGKETCEVDSFQVAEGSGGSVRCVWRKPEGEVEAGHRIYDASGTFQDSAQQFSLQEYETAHVVE